MHNELVVRLPPRVWRRSGFAVLGGAVLDVDEAYGNALVKEALSTELGEESQVLRLRVRKASAKLVQ